MVGRKNNEPETEEKRPMSKRKEDMSTRTGRLAKGVPCLVLALTLCWTPVHASSSYDGDETLLDNLHNKGIVSDEEYEQLQGRDKAFDKVLRFLGGIEIGTLSYFQFSGGKHDNDQAYNQFLITRGYINIKKQLTPWLGFRVTPDVHQESNGDFTLRLKYLYAEFRPPNLSFLTQMKSEVGMGHMPWLDFEEHLNPYRCQGTMFIERAGIFNSADLGVSIRGYFFGQLDEAYQTNVSKHFAGRYGSWHVGVYNGGGYHATEENQNKVPEWRLSVRPLPDIVPGLQVHYFGLYGEGNQEYANGFPQYEVNLGMLSYQNEWVIFTGQYAQTWGNNKGSLVVPGSDQALRGEGYSFFFNTKLPVLDRKLNLFARYDHFNPDMKDAVTPGDACYDLVFGGLAWEFYHHFMWLLVYQQTMYEKNNGGLGKVPVLDDNLADDWQVQTVLQIEF
jgi:hypothetical protein